MIALAAASLTMTSCKKEDVDAKAKEYAEKIVDAMMNSDEQEMIKLSEEAEKWMEGLSEEDKAKANAAFDKAGKEAAEKMFGGLAEGLDSATEEIESAGAELEEAAGELEDALSEAAAEAVEE